MRISRVKQCFHISADTALVLQGMTLLICLKTGEKATMHYSLLANTTSYYNNKPKQRFLDVETATLTAVQSTFKINR